jgi:hypothetical protein
MRSSKQKDSELAALLNLGNMFRYKAIQEKKTNATAPRGK